MDTFKVITITQHYLPHQTRCYSHRIKR